MLNRVIVFRETPKANGTCFPKYIVPKVPTVCRQVDIDIAAHFNFGLYFVGCIVCKLRRVLYFDNFVS